MTAFEPPMQLEHRIAAHTSLDGRRYEQRLFPHRQANTPADHTERRGDNDEGSPSQPRK